MKSSRKMGHARLPPPPSPTASTLGGAYYLSSYRGSVGAPREKDSQSVEAKNGAQRVDTCPDQGDWWGLDLVECLYQQAQEIALVQAAYPEARVSDRGLVALAAQCASVTGADPAALGAELASRGDITFVVPLRDQALTLSVSLPRGYPELPLHCSVHDLGPLVGTSVENGGKRGKTLDRSQQERLAFKLRDAAKEAAEEADLAVLLVLQAAEDFVDGERLAASSAELRLKESRRPPRRGDHTDDAAANAAGGSTPTDELVLGRRLIYSHHIIANDKRAAIRKWAIELGLGGFVKHGWPGVVVVEGAEADADEYVRRLKRSFRWQHLVVRGEETERLVNRFSSSSSSISSPLTASSHTTRHPPPPPPPPSPSLQRQERDTAQQGIDALRKFPKAFEELGSGSEALSNASTRCALAGLSPLFETLFRRGGGGVSGREQSPDRPKEPSRDTSNRKNRKNKGRHSRKGSATLSGANGTHHSSQNSDVANYALTKPDGTKSSELDRFDRNDRPLLAADQASFKTRGTTREEWTDIVRGASKGNSRRSHRTSSTDISTSMTTLTTRTKMVTLRAETEGMSSQIGRAHRKSEKKKRRAPKISQHSATNKV